jgi:hypothetical protein
MVVSQTRMESQKKQLEEGLTLGGWRIVDREPISSEWWADEIWAIESVWRPVGFTLFLTFLVDLMQSGSRRPGEAVAAVSCSPGHPRTREEATDGPMIYLRPSWGQNLPGFLDSLKEIRDRRSAG